MSDPGLETVEFIFQAMKIDEEWSVREERGFTWWGKDFAQHVWTEPPIEQLGLRVCRVHARTDFLQGVERSPRNLGILNGLAMWASLSGPILVPEDPGRVQLAASVYVHEENVEWLKWLFMLVVAIQAADAQIKAQGMAELLKVKPASSAHPRSGHRLDLDDALNVIELWVAPEGMNRSKWVGKDFADTLNRLQSSPCLLATGGETDLTAEFPFLGFSSLLRVTTDEPHPQLGYGVLMLLRIPRSYSREEGDRLALELNLRELQSRTRSHFLGSWCNGPEDELDFIAFFPNSAHRRGLLSNLVISMIQRAKWVAEEVFGDDWSKSFGEGKPAVMHLVDFLRKAK